MTQLIPLAYVNEACYTSENIDEKKLRGSLDEAQEDLRELLGSEFYDEIEDDYSGNTLSSANSTLYEDYLKIFLAWQTYFYFLGFSQSDSTATGERSFNDDSTQLATDFILHSKEKNVQRRATKFKQRIVSYLELEQSKDSTAFPLYDPPCREELSFAVTAVARETNADAIISVNRAITSNE